MARRTQHSQEEIRNGRFNFNMVKLLPDRRKALHQLEGHIKKNIDDYEKSFHQTVKQFYIGKSSVPHSKHLQFDIDDPQTTWESTRIQSRWSDHKRKGYTTMVVIGAITDNTLPNRLENAQKYCLSLESELINLFKFDIKDKRIANDTSNAGREANDDDTIAYVLYIVMKLEQPPHMHDSSPVSRRRNCGKCPECRASDCGNCKNCRDMPKFGGPGKKKQRCIRRKCRYHLERPLRSSQQQFSVQRHGQGSTALTKYHKIKRSILDFASTLREAHKYRHGRDREMVINDHNVTIDDKNKVTHNMELYEHKHSKDSHSSLYKQGHSKRSMQLQGSIQKVESDREKRMEAHTSLHHVSRKRSSANIDMPLSERSYNRHKMGLHPIGPRRMVTSLPNRSRPMESVHVCNYNRVRKLDRSRPRTKGHTWKSQTHTRMWKTDKERREDHTRPHLTHSSRKRPLRNDGMTFS